MKPIVFFLLLAGQAAFSQELSDAQVTLPYSEVKRLIAEAKEVGNTDRPSAPIGAVISNCSYSLSSVTDGRTEGSVSFSIESLSDQWQLLPLLDRNLSITKVSPASSLLFTTDDSLALGIRKEGSHKLTIDFTITGNKERLFDFNAFPATISSLAFDISDDRDLRISGGVASSKDDALVYLPSSGGRVSGEWRSSRIEKESDWIASCESLVTCDPDFLSIRTRIQLQTEDPEPGGLAQILLPRSARIENLTSDSLDHYQASPSGKGDHQELTIRWKNQGISSRLIEVSYALPRPLANTRWIIPLPTIAGEGQSQGITVVCPPEDLDLIPENHPLLNQRVPPWMKGYAKGSGPFLIKNPDTQICQFRSEAKDRLKTAHVRIKKASYETSLVRGGESLTEAELNLDHEESVEFEFRIPEGATLLSSHRNDEAIDPHLGKSGSLSIPLVGKEGASVLKFTFTAKSPGFDPVEGATALTLISSSVFCQELRWSVGLPHGYTSSAVDGNISFDPAPPKDRRLHLLKKFSLGETPTIQIYYRKQSLEH